jgi:hypothetical protein
VTRKYRPSGLPATWSVWVVRGSICVFARARAAGFSIDLPARPGHCCTYGGRACISRTSGLDNPCIMHACIYCTAQNNGRRGVLMVYTTDDKIPPLVLHPFHKHPSFRRNNLD